MNLSALFALLLLGGDGEPVGERYAQLTIRQRLIVRVPVPRRADPPTRWREKKAPRCMPMTGLAGATISGPDSVDIILRSGERVRAELETSCPALDFYSGFYVLPTEDRRICADRDAIRDRSGGECQIERFRKLVPDTRPRR